MKRNLVILVLVLVLAMVAVVPAFAHNAGPCNDSGEPGHSDYAKHPIVAMALNGDLGKVDHDGDEIAHVPGAHKGFSACK